MMLASIHDVRSALENPTVTARALAAVLRCTARQVRKARQNRGPALDNLAAHWRALWFFPAIPAD